MPHIRTGKEFRFFHKPDFCFLCGQLLDGSQEENDEHCPPRRLFNTRDLENYPIILRVHLKCNEAWSQYDDQAAAMWSVLSGNKTNAEQIERTLKMFDAVPGGKQKVVYNFASEKLSYRILRMAHALFYKQFIPGHHSVLVFSPMLELDKKTLQPKDRQTKLFLKFCKLLIHAQAHDQYNSIMSHRGKFRYMHAFTKSDEGLDICVFAFDINGTNFFNPQLAGTPRCYVGYYPWPKPQGAPFIADLPLIDIPTAFQNFPIKFRWEPKEKPAPNEGGGRTITGG